MAAAEQMWELTHKILRQSVEVARAEVAKKSLSPKTRTNASTTRSTGKLSYFFAFYTDRVDLQVRATAVKDDGRYHLESLVAGDKHVLDGRGGVCVLSVWAAADDASQSFDELAAASALHGIRAPEDEVQRGEAATALLGLGL